MKVAIVGLGLIGGSLAKAIKAQGSHEVFGEDAREETMIMAKMSGAIDGELTEEILSDCDLIFLAVPPSAILAWTKEKAPLIPKKATLVDLCGIKRSICSSLAPLAKEHGFSYIGGHPMAGKEVSGFTHADADLFRGASMILTPDETTDMDMLEELKTFFLDIGFERLVFSTPEEHDRILSYTSQLAHITSSAYIKSPTAQSQFGFSAGSYRDMTRVAKLDENLWTELFLGNTDHLTKELKDLILHLSQYLDALEGEDAPRLRELLAEGRELKATAGGD